MKQIVITIPDETIYFTPRQQDILHLFAMGITTNAQISQKLGLHIRTVKGHISDMIHKTKAKNRTELAVKYALKESTK